MNKLAGFLIVTVATTLYALLYPLTKKANQHIPPFMVMAISMFVLFALSLIASLLFEKGFNFKGDDVRTSVLILIILGAVNFIAFWLIILGYKYFEVWQIGLFSLLTPVLAGIFAYFILGEKLTINLFIGLAIMAVGLYIAIR